MSALFPAPSESPPKVIVSAGRLPGYVADSQAPTKRPPWRTIREVSYGDGVSITLPDDLYRTIWDSVEADVSNLKYAKVILKLEDILRGDFFTEYIKKGNVFMISEGELGVDDTFSLKEGILRLQLSKESYERAGLQGLPVPSGGRKHVKAWYLVEVNLRLPSALRGKKGFDRLLWAAQNVLNKSLNWLFLDLNTAPNSQTEGPLSAHHPTVQTLVYSKQEPTRCLVPTTLTTCPVSSTALSSEETQESIHDLLEYLDMVALASPRVEASKQIDSFLSRYAVPDSSESSCSLRKITWNGLISSRWVLELICSIIKNSRIKDLSTYAVQQQWLAISVSALKTEAIHQTDGYTILLQPFHVVEQPEAVDNADGVPRRAEENKSGMDEDQTDSEMNAIEGTTMPKAVSTNEDQPNSETIAPRAGFQRFICAEYLDSLA